MKIHARPLLIWAILWTCCSHGNGQPRILPLELEEFIYDEAPFPSCHASTLVELENGDLLSAWFGGLREGDESVEIWFSRRQRDAHRWTAPQQVTDFPDMPCWNPVLFRGALNRVWLFFKIGPNPMSWVGAYRQSSDGGLTWSDIVYLPAGQLGPIRCKPLRLSNGVILAGTSVEAGRGENSATPRPYWSWASWVERSEDMGVSWTIHGPITFPGVNFGLIQPTLWETDSGQVRALMRATSQIGRICESISYDGGLTWTRARATSLPNPNSGIDAVKLSDGRVVLVYNHTLRGRTPLNLAISRDDGENWDPPFALETEPGEFSYPAIIQADDGKLHITYTWKRVRIKHVVADPHRIH